MFVTYTLFLYNSMVSRFKDDYKSIKTINIMNTDEIDDFGEKDQIENDDDTHMKIDIRNKSRHIETTNEFFLNDLDFMPVYEIKSLNQAKTKKFDIYKNKMQTLFKPGDNDASNAWDASLSIDYRKLQKYIQFQVNIMTTKNGKTSNLITDFKNCAEEDFENNGYKRAIVIGA